MANPQKEDGHVQIATELFEQLMALKISGSEFQLLLTVIRKTWGWGKKEDYISLTQLSRLTGLPHRTICRAKNKLVSKKTLLYVNGLMKFNKNYEQWVVSKVAPVSKVALASVKSGIRLVSKKTLTIDTLTIDTKTIETPKFPFLLDTSFKDLWNAWLEVRKKLKTPNTPVALDLALGKLHKHEIDVAKAMLEQAVERGWRGIYPCKEQAPLGAAGRKL